LLVVLIGDLVRFGMMDVTSANEDQLQLFGRIVSIVVEASGPDI